jgi:mono/diheme cytochrome c family protein/uncharacterized membrane protein
MNLASLFLQASTTTDHFLEFIGRFHPLFVHLPIGIIILALGLAVLSRRPRYANLEPAVKVALFWGFVSAVAACVAGYCLKLSGGYEEDTLNLHQNLGIGVAITAGLAWAATNFANRREAFRKAQFPAVVFCAVLLFGAGHFGGNLTHGEDYLTQPLLAMTGNAPEKKERPKITDINQAVVYTDLVEPVLEQKCWQCHNARKSKGDFRMDQPDLLAKGGEDGPAFVAGNAEKSELYKRLILPDDDEHHMPPKGKTQLSEQEIALIQWWIAKANASFNTKVAQVQQDAKIKPILAAYGAGAAPESEEDKILKLKVAEASKGDVEKLTKQNVLVMPVANESTLLMVNTVNAPAFNDQTAEALAPLNEQVVWLKLGNTKIGDAGLKSVGKLKNLTRLGLEQTAITDAGLTNLSGLKHLEHLNLYGTKVTDAGLKALAGMKQLKTLYLWQTAVTPAGVEALKKQLPKTQIDTGGYALQKLPTDTLVFKKKEKAT